MTSNGIKTGPISETGEQVKHQRSGTKITQALTGGDHTRRARHDTRITLNVGGVRHDTWASTLEQLPGTRLALLAHLRHVDESYDAASGEYFFDRHPKAFDSILHYYRTLELHVDQSICGNTLKSELKFWGIEEHEIEPCCWADYSKYTEHKETLRNLDDNFAMDVDEESWHETSPSHRKMAAWLWRFMEEPGSSRWAKLYAVASMFFVALSIAIFVLETHKLFQVDRDTGISMITLLPDDELTSTGSMQQCCCEANTGSSNATIYQPVTHPALKYLDYVSVAVFSLELTLRFAVCPKKTHFFRAPLNIIELICLLPHFASIIMSALTPHSEAAALVKAIMILRVIRILRIFKLMKHYNAFKILVYTIKVSTKELFLMIVFLMTGVLMFASIIHYTERENFPNIPIGIWWALVTMTTVGYGDKYPVGYVGFVVGSVCVICGVLVIAFTVPIVVNNFSLYYSHAQTRIKVPSHRKHTRQFAPKTQHKKHSHDKRKSVSTISDKIAFQIPRRTSVASHDMPPKKATNFSKIQTEKTIHRDSDDFGKKTKSTRHGDDVRGGTFTPVEELSDQHSLDSGFEGEIKATQKLKAVEEETLRLMKRMKDADLKLDEERKRQEQIILMKRQERARNKDQTPRIDHSHKK